jgi:AcrR family transcriptional regulator
MAFGKPLADARHPGRSAPSAAREPPARQPGRPPEDRLARQTEIYRAVAPLIVEHGVKRLSMRAAARSSHMSVGGLYHYFPTKRDLVLHALRDDAVDRYCEDFTDRYGMLAETDPEAYLSEYTVYIARMVELCRPSVLAALELGMDVFLALADRLTSGIAKFRDGVRALVPDMCDEDVDRFDRTLHRMLVGALLDRNLSQAQLADELHHFVTGIRRSATVGSRPVATVAG